MRLILFASVFSVLPAVAANCPCATVRTRTTQVRTAYRSPRVYARVNGGSADRIVEERRTVSAVTLPSGTRIPVRLGETLDTKHDRPGTPFLAHVAAPVVVGRGVVVPRGAVARGHLVESKPSGRLKGRAVMSLSLDSLEFNGRRYGVVTSDPVFVSGNHKRRNLATIGGGAAGGAAIGAIAGDGLGAAVGAGAGALAGTVGAAFTGKKNLRLPSETRLDFTLRQPVRVGV